MNRRRALELLGSAAIAALWPSAAFADRRRRRGRRRRHGRGDEDDHEDGHEKREHDYERATSAHQKGDVLPLREILAEVRKTFKGEVVGVTFKENSDMKVYEIKLVTPTNLYLEIYVNATTNQIVKVEGDE